MKKLVIAAVVFAVLMLLSLGLFAACVVRAGSGVHFGLGPSESATRQETRPLELAAGKLLDVNVRTGTIRVTASADESPSLSAKLTAFGGTQEQADRALAELVLDVQNTAEGALVRVRGERKRERSFFGSLTVTSGYEAELEIRVPPGVRLELHSDSGDVSGSGPFASSKVHSSYGSVEIRDVEGELEATSSSGDVTVRGTKGKKAFVKSSYGSVGLTDCECAETDVRSSSGDVKLENVRGGRIRVESSYGDVTVERASGPLEVKSSSGAVKIRDYEGALVARSSYGTVNVAGVLSALQVDSSSGDVTVRAKSGSRVEDAWTVSSSYGSVKLILPDGLGCHLDAKTNYGEVDVEVPIEADAGPKNKSSHAVRGKLNGGGGSIELRCSSGDVKVESGGK